jgi:pimeloyl-ACP methyl ester carboxylesterase
MTQTAALPLSRAAEPHAPPVLALHSSGAGARQWARWQALLPAGVRWLAPDLLGYGSDAGPVAAATLDDEVAHLEPWLAPHPGGVHLVGHSYGGAVALRLALRWPQKVLSLSLYEPVAFALLRDDPAREGWAEIERVGLEIARLAAHGELETAARTFVDYWTGPGAFSALPAATQRAVASRMAKVGAEFHALFADATPAPAYARLSMPVCVVGGSRSPGPARRILQRLQALLPQARVTTLAGAGHMAPLECPERVMAAMGLLDATLSAARAA